MTWPVWLLCPDPLCHLFGHLVKFYSSDTAQFPPIAVIKFDLNSLCALHSFPGRTLQTVYHCTFYFRQCKIYSYMFYRGWNVALIKLIGPLLEPRDYSVRSSDSRPSHFLSRSQAVRCRIFMKTFISLFSYLDYVKDFTYDVESAELSKIDLVKFYNLLKRLTGCF